MIRVLTALAAAILGSALAAADAGAPPRPAWAAGAGSDGQGAYADLAEGPLVQRLRWIPPGTFIRGEAPAATVTLTAGLWLADSECTQALWLAVMETSPSEFAGDPARPVETVSWDDCQDFLRRLNARRPGLGARLPSEAEWEYACRAGGDGTAAADLAAFAWFDRNAGNSTHAVKTRQANPWGLHDLHGNVWEWCADWYGEPPAGALTDPAGPAAGTHRVSRGGSWFSSSMFCRAEVRGRNAPITRRASLGFRFAIPATAPAQP